MAGFVIFCQFGNSDRIYSLYIKKLYFFSSSIFREPSELSGELSSAVFSRLKELFQ